MAKGLSRDGWKIDDSFPTYGRGMRGAAGPQGKMRLHFAHTLTSHLSALAGCTGQFVAEATPAHLQPVKRTPVGANP